jgi:hypothetical protein
MTSLLKNTTENYNLYKILFLLTSLDVLHQNVYLISQSELAVDMIGKSEGYVPLGNGFESKCGRLIKKHFTTTY